MPSATSIQLTLSVVTRLLHEIVQFLGKFGVREGPGGGFVRHCVDMSSVVCRYLSGGVEGARDGSLVGWDCGEWQKPYTKCLELTAF